MSRADVAVGPNREPPTRADRAPALHVSGRHFLQIPGPTNVPDRVLRAIDAPTIDHRGPQFARLGLDLLEAIKAVFQTEGPVVIYPSSGTGAWEAALVNTLSPGDRVLAFETGQFSTLWRTMAERLGLDVEWVPGAASASARLPRSYWEWEPIIEANRAGFWPYTPPTNLLYGLREAVAMLMEEGLPAVFARHERHAETTRRAVRAWGLEVLCADEREYSGSLTAILMPEGHDADEVRRIVLERFDMSLGTGLGKLRGRVFRIGHLGHFNDLMLAGTLCGVELGLALAGVPINRGGIDEALEYLERTA